MFPYDLVASDFDGTLSCGYSTMLPPKALDVITRVRDSGAVFALVSGRAPFNLQDISKRDGLKLDGLYLSGFNGAKTIQAWDGKVLDQHYIEHSLADQLIVELQREGLEVLLVSDGVIFTNDPDLPMADFERRINKVKMSPVPNSVDDSHQINKLTVAGPPELVAEAIGLVRERYSSQVETTFTAKEMADITPAGITKGTGLRFLRNLHDLPQSKTLAFGDQHNDIPLFAAAGFGVAVGNAVDELKQVANAVTLSCSNSGVPDYLEKLLIAGNYRK